MDQEITEARGKFLAMAAAYCLGVFNDNFFKQAAMLMAVSAGLSHLQGTATVLFALPFILFSSSAGWLADRFAKRRVVIWVKALELVAMLLGAVGMVTGNWTAILAMIFIMGMQATLFSPALNGSIPELYPAHYVPKANAILKLVTTLAILLGIATAGMALDQRAFTIGNLPPGPLLVAVVVMVVAAGGLVAGLGIAQRPAAAAGKPFPRLGPLASVKDLFTICSNRQMLTAFFADNFFYFLATILVLTINTMAVRQLGLSQTVTSLLSMSLMLGVCVGSFFAARLVAIERWSRLLALSAAGMAAGLLLAAATVLLPSPLQLPWFFAALAATGICGGLFLIPVASFLQVRPAASDKGLVLATVNFTCFIAIIAAGAIFSWLDRHFLPSQAMAILAGLAVLAVLCLALLQNPKVRPVPAILHRLIRFVLGLRYRVEVRGLEGIEQKAGPGLLFLPNHQALVDPVIVMVQLYRRFRPRPLSDAEQAEMGVNRLIMRHIRPITLPDGKKAGRDGKARIQEALRETAAALAAGDNILLYPSGRLCRGAREDLAGNSGVEYLLRQVPGVRTVLIRTTGLWGSSFSWGRGTAPSIYGSIGAGLRYLAANLLFFGPRRGVTLEVVEDAVLPQLSDRQAINAHLEAFYNATPHVNTHVPYYWWQGRTPQVLPEPELAGRGGDVSAVPEATRRLVLEKISVLAGASVRGEDKLAGDLAMDSLTLMELASWLEGEFGVPVDNLEGLVTVDDCLLAAAGQVMGTGQVESKALPAGWFSGSGERLALGDGDTIPALFLAQARRHPGKIILADQLSGCRTYREVLTAIFVLRDILGRLPGERLGIMLPASASSAILYLATLFAGKVPVMINWTVGIANLQHGLQLTGVNTVVTARALTKKLSGQGVDLDGVQCDWLYLDELAPTIPLTAKIFAALRARFTPGVLSAANIPTTAAILFTSGSEARPKAVPLTHANILANLRDFAEVVTFTDDNRLLGMLPPFHSLGLVGTIILPLCLGLKTVYHANPTESSLLAGLIERYRATILIGTPTFLIGILKAGSALKLRSLRLVFTGAEKCPESTYQTLARVNPKATLCEGYGITECSPLVSINRTDDPRPGTIGRVMPSMEYAVVDGESGARVAAGRQGILLVRGPNIFGGYLNEDCGKGFTRFEDQIWYDTGDFVREEGGVLTFCGRKKRFIKLGGEMISLPAIENALLAGVEAIGDNGPPLAVEATPVDSHPEVVLFTTIALTREEANARIKAAGLSPLHHIRIVHQVEAISVLGTGKTDYKQLKAMLALAN